MVSFNPSDYICDKCDRQSTMLTKTHHPDPTKCNEDTVQYISLCDYHRWCRDKNKSSHCFHLMKEIPVGEECTCEHCINYKMTMEEIEKQEK